MSYRSTVLCAIFVALSASVAFPVQTTCAQTAKPIEEKPVLATLHTFTGRDGETPECTLVLGPGGDLYGTTTRGGKGYGTIFKITQDGRFTSLAQFDYWNGAIPLSLVFDAKSNGFYGAAETGGTNRTGTLFHVTPEGKIIALHSFGPKPAGKSYANAGGANPFSSPIVGKDGALYGTVRNGGRYGGGILYKLSLDGTFTVLHDFKPDDGQHSERTPYQNADGTLYGTTSDGGHNGYGTVYQVGLNGKYKVLHSFSPEDGVYPKGPPTSSPGGGFEGIMREGHASGKYWAYLITRKGDFYRISTEGSNDTFLPAFASTHGPDGSFYDTTFHWTSADGGTVYRVTPQSQVTLLYQFHAGAGGYGPCGGITFMPNGVLYGTTYNGGLDALGADTGHGTIYKLTLPQ